MATQTAFSAESGDGQSLAAVCRQQKVRRQTLTHWLDNYLHGGFNALFVRAPVHRAQLLSAQRQRIVRYIMLHKTPADYGIDSWMNLLCRARLTRITPGLRKTPSLRYRAMNATGKNSMVF
ncbi:MAG: hypothetical protein PHD43_06005 [Methylococcales bacterium]|nr:hypothetical protein [Methylococcales bacterium]